MAENPPNRVCFTRGGDFFPGFFGLQRGASGQGREPLAVFTTC